MVRLSGPVSGTGPRGVYNETPRMQGWNRKPQGSSLVVTQSHTGGMHTEVRGLIVPVHYGRPAAAEKLSLWGCALVAIYAETQGWLN